MLIVSSGTVSKILPNEKETWSSRIIISGRKKKEMWNELSVLGGKSILEKIVVL